MTPWVRHLSHRPKMRSGNHAARSILWWEVRRAVAAQAGISRESLYRSLSPKGNPTLKTLVAVLKTLGLRLSIADRQKAEASQSKDGDNYAAA
jgi:hypothetical protein